MNWTRLTEQSIDTRQRLGQRRLPDARDVLDQQVALGEQRDQCDPHDVRLAHEHVLRRSRAIRWASSATSAKPRRGAGAPPFALGRPAPRASAGCPSSSPDPPRRRRAPGLATQCVKCPEPVTGAAGWSARPARSARSAGPLPTGGAAVPPPSPHRAPSIGRRKSLSCDKLTLTDCLDLRGGDASTPRVGRRLPPPRATAVHLQERPFDTVVTIGLWRLTVEQSGVVW